AAAGPLDPPGPARAAAPAGRSADGWPGEPGRPTGPGRVSRGGAGLAALEAALDGRRPLVGRARLRRRADRLARGRGAVAAATGCTGRVRLPFDVGDHGHHRLRLLRRTDHPRAA